MTNEEAMRICTDIGVHEGGMENWVMDNAWVKFAELVAEQERQECIQNVLEQYEGFGTEHQGVEYVKQRIVEAIRARSKA
jgi:F0F1-type ATP synthase delta subunit